MIARVVFFRFSLTVQGHLRPEPALRAAGALEWHAGGPGALCRAG